ncbi:MAG TPA: sugar phosphate isomerase/epimerase family protein [Verrucomicrobiae bacterium]|nr:sugar phosphate isomerase/epimerase family protein [Verrucomicrobiae bacterium]
MTRRLLLQTATAATVLAQPARLKLGIILSISPDPDADIRRVHDLGFPTCQVMPRDTSAASAANLRRTLDKYGIEATSAVATGPPPETYDFYHGPATIGLVPRQYRQARMARIQEVSTFAKAAGIPAVQTHCGFIPEDPNDPLYGETIEAIRTVAQYCGSNGQDFRCETGQETPITLLRALRDVNLKNVGVNFDVGNLILYGKGDPAMAVDILGPFVQGVHAKDGLYPTDPKQLGKEVPIGKGEVKFATIIGKLKAYGYRNPLTIEREIQGDQQTADILEAKAYLENLL